MCFMLQKIVYFEQHLWSRTAVVVGCTICPTFCPLRTLLMCRPNQCTLCQFLSYSDTAALWVLLHPNPPSSNGTTGTFLLNATGAKSSWPICWEFLFYSHFCSHIQNTCKMDSISLPGDANLKCTISRDTCSPFPSRTLSHLLDMFPTFTLPAFPIKVYWKPFYRVRHCCWYAYPWSLRLNYCTTFIFSEQV